MRFSKAPVTALLMLAIVLVFIVEALHAIPPAGHPPVPGGLTVRSLLDATKNPEVLDSMGAIVPGLFHDHAWWRLFAALFLHAGILHVCLNMWALFQLGYVFEMMFGSRRFALTYFVAGIGASVTSAAFAHDAGSVGASGAIFGILGALIFAIRRSPFWREQRWALGLARQLIGWAALNVAIGFMVPNIDNAAHLGGFVTGLLLGFLPHRVPPPPPSSIVLNAETVPANRN
ncbi:MAG TPA: rhomboid family intramembrane serine protease [Thermoanaerobaculia bacterium]|nr:rhomboid family intramembrane serine protease [Thermoanaerobaculia bacterium]